MQRGVWNRDRFAWTVYEIMLVLDDIIITYM